MRRLERDSWNAIKTVIARREMEFNDDPNIVRITVPFHQGKGKGRGKGYVYGVQKILAMCFLDRERERSNK